MDELIKIFNEFPFLLPSSDFKSWDGFIVIKTYQVQLKISTPNFPSLEGLSLFCNPDVARIIGPQMKSLFQSKSLMEVLNSIVHFCKLNSFGEEKLASYSTEKVQKCKLIVGDLEGIGEENIDELDENLHYAKLSYVDQMNEKHSLSFSFVDYPKVPLVINACGLPNEAKAEITGIMNVKQLYFKFCSIVESLIAFWSLLKEIDDNAYVIEPKNPQKQDTYRRIFLEGNLSVVVTLSPFKPTDPPEITFLGTIEASEKMRKLYFDNLKRKHWDENLSILENLKILLEIVEFPPRPALDSYEGLLGPTTCCICFSDDNDEPDKSPAIKWCNNIKCDSRYHLECILQWFESLPNATRIFSYISGPCPYCDDKVFCPTDKLKPY